MTMFNKVSKSFRFGNHDVTLTTGEIARQATGACICQMDDTVVLATVVAKKETKPGQDFFPLTVDYIEKTYAAGKIPGGFFKREGRPSEKETLTSRLIDRPIRPLFPDGFFNEVQVIIHVLSADPAVDPDIPAMIGASAALAISGIPFRGPIGACRVGYINDEIVINPTTEELKTSRLDLDVAGTERAVLMVESEADILPEKTMLEAVMAGHKAMQVCIQAINELVAEAGKPAWDWQPAPKNEALVARIVLPVDEVEAGADIAGHLPVDDVVGAGHIVERLFHMRVEHPVVDGAAEGKRHDAAARRDIAAPQVQLVKVVEQQLDGGVLGLDAGIVLVFIQLAPGVIEGADGRQVLFGERMELPVRVLSDKTRHMVPFLLEPASGQLSQIGLLIDIVIVSPVRGDGELARIPLLQLGLGFQRHRIEIHGTADSLGVPLHRLDGLALVAALSGGPEIITGVAHIAADEHPAVVLGDVRIVGMAPHELGHKGVTAAHIVAGTHDGRGPGEIIDGDGMEFDHKTSLIAWSRSAWMASMGRIAPCSVQETLIQPSVRAQ